MTYHNVTSDCRYKSRACECSVYSCLTQFTAPELLTGNNKWACERCTDIAAARKRELINGRKTASSSEDEAEDEAEAAEAAEDGEMKKTKSGKKETVYSNASKQGRGHSSSIGDKAEPLNVPNLLNLIQCSAGS